ncbi:hypothetical protein GGX14DRAFT_393650 [Mycena pura]|uniref:Uncharacterized protein n=1 Tax=Mycena pura TaxID=153505 RepID=A0AAD6VNG5_9AGAR|nr:hypothetical protein GGX14DRAFT_393650 [Mycena pura]
MHYNNSRRMFWVVSNLHTCPAAPLSLSNCDAVALAAAAPAGHGGGGGDGSDNGNGKGVLPVLSSGGTSFCATRLSVSCLLSSFNISFMSATFWRPFLPMESLRTDAGPGLADDDDAASSCPQYFVDVIGMLVDCAYTVTARISALDAQAGRLEYILLSFAQQSYIMAPSPLSSLRFFLGANKLMSEINSLQHQIFTYFSGLRSDYVGNHTSLQVSFLGNGCSGSNYVIRRSDSAFPLALERIQAVNFVGKNDRTHKTAMIINVTEVSGTAEGLGE